MSPLKVICPKCFKGQQVIGEIPLGGVDHVCLLCKTTFRVRPPRPSSDDLPAPREAIPKPGDLPAARESVPRPADLPVPREAVPKHGDLPAARESVPRPADLPAARESIPRPGDLPAARESIPRPGDLPAPREALPRPGDLPVDRDAVPRPGDLPAPRDRVPRPGDLPVAKASSFGPNLPLSADAVPERSKTPPLGLALELSLSGELPPLDDGFKLDPPPAAPANGPSSTPPPLPGRKGPPILKPAPPASPPSTPAPPSAPRPGLKPLSPLAPLAPDPASMELPDLAFPAMPAPAPVPSTPAGPPQASILFDELPPAAEPVGQVRPSRQSGVTKAASKGLDLGFSLELEGQDEPRPAECPAAIPFPTARVANEGMAEAAAADVGQLPSLAPPSMRAASASKAMRPVAKKLYVPRWVYVAAGGVVVLGVAAAIGVPMLRSAPNPDAVLRPLMAELPKDSVATYGKAADQLIQTAAKFKDAPKLRLRAAELILTANLVHGGPAADVTKAESLIPTGAPEPKLAAATGRARALLAVAKGKPREAEKALADKNAAESQLVVALARLADNKPADAVEALRRYLAVRPNDLAAHYLLGKTLAASKPADAKRALELVLAQNPAHAGAQIALVRLEETPERQLAGARALVDKKLGNAGSVELAELHLLMGQAAQALGRTPEATDAFQRAIAQDKRLIAASLALGESLLYEGKYGKALEQLKAPGPALESSAQGKFALGGALIATGAPLSGLPMIAAAAKELPDDPRGPFWNGFAASARKPPDFVAAEQGYRDAIKRDPKFLPAALKLAALLQQLDKAQESLTVLRAAEEAGAPPSVLQLAWGEALIVAKQPAKAEDVFQKALDADPKSISARLGVAAALEAQNKLAEAKASLENTLKQAPKTLGVRERLAQVCLKLGEKDEALTRYQEELQAGQPSVALRLALARLALDLGKVDLAQSEVKKVFEESPRNAEAAYLMARVNEGRNEITGAIQEYRHATTWGNTPPYALGFGRLMVKLGKDREALPILANAVALPEGRLERGRLYYRAGDLESALADFQAAAKMIPDEAEPLILQGLCLDKMGQTSKAEESWRAALRADSAAPEPHYRLGRMELDRAKPSAAIDHFRKAAAKVDDKAPWAADLYFQLAQAELLTGSKAAALAGFKKFLDLSPPDAPAVPEATKQVARLGGGKK